MPFHHGHEAMVKHALNIADRAIVVIGTPFRPRTPKNPFTLQERVEMILGAFPEEAASGRLLIAFVPDFFYDERAWEMSLEESVKETVLQHHPNPGTANIGFLGLSKEGDMENWLENIPVTQRIEPTELYNGVDGTWIRKCLFTDGQRFEENVRNIVPPNVWEFLLKFRDTSEWEALRRYHEFIIEYKKPYAQLPFGVIFQTVDAVVECEDCVLLIKRKREPGKGLWAIPGGFLDVDERIEDACERELTEETGLRGVREYLVGRERFDHPGRDLRGRMITDCFHFKMPGLLPSVKGADDADEAQWAPKGSIVSDDMMGDHWDMLRHLGVIDG
jgi:bifunctional NMN adenylyltransferase/nudix hydrolase